MLVVTELEPWFVYITLNEHRGIYISEDSQHLVGFVFSIFDHWHPAVAHIPMPFDQLTVGWSIDVRGPGPSNTARNSQSTDWTQPRAQGQPAPRASLLSQVAADGLLY